MRAPLLTLATLCALASASVSPLSAQGGGKKHRKADSTQTPTADQTIKTSTTAASPFTFKSDATFKGTTTVSSGFTPASEVSPVTHATPTRNSPIGLEWDLNTGGRIQLHIFGNGDWIMNGPAGAIPGSDLFDLALAVKSKSGEVYIFHYLGQVPGSSNLGNGDAVPNVAGLYDGFEVKAAYRLPTRDEAKAERKGVKAKGECKTSAPLAAGWGAIWQWAATGTRCTQFNLIRL